jgi:hypothetical protein
MLYLIVYPDGIMLTFRSRPNPDHFLPNCKFYQVDEDTTLAEVSDWIGYGYPDVDWLKALYK